MNTWSHQSDDCVGIFCYYKNVQFLVNLHSRLSRLYAIQANWRWLLFRQIEIYSWSVSNFLMCGTIVVINAGLFPAYFNLFSSFLYLVSNRKIMFNKYLTSFVINLTVNWIRLGLLRYSRSIWCLHAVFHTAIYSLLRLGPFKDFFELFQNLLKTRSKFFVPFWATIFRNFLFTLRLNFSTFFWLKKSLKYFPPNLHLSPLGQNLVATPQQKWKQTSAAGWASKFSNLKLYLNFFHKEVRVIWAFK